MPPLSRGLASSRVNPQHFYPIRWSCHRYSSISNFLRISEEVRDALQTMKPVVALETTIYTHGFTYPENVALSSRLESLVRLNGAIPATIGILNGVARVGMEPSDLIGLVSTAGSPNTLKISRRDLGFIGGLGLIGRKLNGGTTVAGTMVLAHLAGIKVFATGGLGGVHRGGENSLDISADLTELGRTPVAVISSGCKSFLDIPRTLEYLETQGVGVGTFADGREGFVDFPAFFSRDSGMRSPTVIKDEKEAAAIIFGHSRLSLQSGLHFANPIPAAQEISKERMDRVISEALRMAEYEGIHGSANTPFVLKKIRGLTKGDSVTANRALIEANVVRGAKVAVELAKLELGEKTIHERPCRMPASSNTSAGAGTISIDPLTLPSIPLTGQPLFNLVVFGSLASDLICDYQPLRPSPSKISPVHHSSNPATVSQFVGGVGHNIALAAHYAGASVLLASIVADDLTGATLVDQVSKSGLDTLAVQQLKASEGFRTPQYVAVNDSKKDLVLAMADMSILQGHLPAAITEHWSSILSSLAHPPKWFVMDTNWSNTVLSRFIALARKHRARLALEPVSIEKSKQIFSQPRRIMTPTTVLPNNVISLATPNIFELEAMYSAARDSFLFDAPAWWEIVNSFELSTAGSRDKFIAMTNAELVEKGVPQQAIQLLPYIPNLVVKLGSQGCLLAYTMPPNHPALSSPKTAPYILSRSTNEKSKIGGVYLRLFPPAELVKQEEIVSVNGVGDTMLGALMAGLVKDNGSRLEELVPIAQIAAVRSLKSAEAVSPEVKSLCSQL